jgi:hypothetical protein
VLAGPAVQALYTERMHELVRYGTTRISTKDLMEAINVDLANS